MRKNKKQDKLTDDHIDRLLVIFADQQQLPVASRYEVLSMAREIKQLRLLRFIDEELLRIAQQVPLKGEVKA